MNERGQIEIPSRSPGAVENRREKNVLAALDRIGLDADQAQQAGDGRADALAEEFGIVEQFCRRSGEGFQNRHRKTGVASRRVHREVRRITHLFDTLAALAPVAKPLFPQGRLLCREVGGGQALLAGVVFINPRREIFAAKLRER
jgi:hypothetical protein